MKEILPSDEPSQSGSINPDLKNTIIIPHLTERWSAGIIDGILLKIAFFYTIILLKTYSVLYSDSDYELFLFIACISFGIIHFCYYIPQLSGRKRATLGQVVSKYKMADYPTGRPASKRQIWLWVTYKFISSIILAVSTPLGWVIAISLGSPVFIKPHRRTFFDRMAGVIMLNNQSVIRRI